MAEHMLILRLTNPQGKRFHIAAAFPSACGKTNLAMLQPTIPGWKCECIGDDIAWMKIRPDGRLHAINPESGFFGVAPGTTYKSNPMAMETIKENSIFTNCVLTDDGDIWWEEMTSTVQARHRLEGPRLDARQDQAHRRAPQRALHRPGRAVPGHLPGLGKTRRRADRHLHLRRPARQRGAAGDPGVRLGPRRVHGRHGRLRGDSRHIGADGNLRRDPMAMLPFCGYHIGDYWQHWFNMGDKLGAKAPKIFYVNWFRKSSGRQVAVAGLRREQPRPEVDVRARRRQSRRRGNAHRLPAAAGRPGPGRA